MKKRFLYPFLVLAALLMPSNMWATAYVVWCNSNSTLYFTNRSETLKSGGTFTPEGSSTNVTITNLWSGTDVTATGTIYPPGWRTRNIYDNATTVIFESSFKNIQPTSTCHWFNEFTQLATIKGLQYLNTGNVTDMGWMFYNCRGLTSLDVSGFETGNVTGMADMFTGCSGLTSLDVSGFDTGNVTNMYCMFHSCSGLTSIDVSGFDTGNVTNMRGMFYGCSGLTSLDVSGFDTKNVTSMNGMFESCSGLTSIDVSGFDTGNVTDMNGMFYGCSGLTSLDVSGFDTGNVTDMMWLFWDCSGLSSLDVSRFDTRNTHTICGMFYGCSSLSSLDLSGFDTRNVGDMFYVFYGCTQLTTIYVSEKWSTDNLYTSTDMFKNCTSLVGGDGTVFDPDYTDKTKAYAGAGGYLTMKGQETEATEYELTVTSATLATLYLDFPVTIPDDENIMGVYYGKQITDGVLLLGKVENVIPSNTGVIVFANPGTYTFERSEDEGTAIADNILQGSTVEQNVSDIDGTVFTLGQGKTGSYIGFYQYTGTTLAANKAYIVLDSSSNVKSLTFSTGEATAISRPEATESGERTFYNLSGQRVTAPRGGLYIVNGKKVFIK